MTKALHDLLARAIELEEKAATVLDRPLTPDAREDLEAQADAGDAEAIAALSDRLEALHAQLDAAAAPPAAVEEPVVDPYAEVLAPADGEKAWGDFDLDEPAGMDFDEPDEVKAGCTHPDDEVEEFADGTKRCDACGAEVKALSDEEQMESWLKETAHLDTEVKSAGVLSEFELLRAQRASLGL